MLGMAEVYGYFIADGFGAGLNNDGLPVAGLGMVSRSTSPLLFVTDNVERMQYHFGGNVGIGTTSPQTGVKLGRYGAAAVAGGSEGLRIGNVGDNSAYDNVKLYYTGYNSGAKSLYNSKNNSGLGHY
jgi:hypothetical protein